MARKTVVTGGSGRLGSMTVEAMLAAGYEVLNLDAMRPREKLCESWTADLTRSGDLFEAFDGADSLIHLAAYQAPTEAADSVIFGNNVTASYNVLRAAAQTGIRRVVMASSVAAYGFIYAPRIWDPETLPLDEDYPCRPMDSYSLSKVFGEQLADSFVATSGMSVASLRIAGVNFDLSYASFPERWTDPARLLGGLWSYVDARDAAEACRLAAEAKIVGHRVYNIAAATSRDPTPTEELVRKFFPGTRIRDGMAGCWGGLDVARARDELGFATEHHWQDYLRLDGTPIAADARTPETGMGR